MTKTAEKLELREKKMAATKMSELTTDELEKVTGGAVGVAQYSRMVKERYEREKKG